VRVWVALDVPEKVRQGVGELMRQLEPACRGARWVRTQGMHLTLKFIGETAPETVERIQAELGAVRSATPVEMRFRGVGFFPNAKHPRVFWAGIEASPNLTEIAADIERRMEGLGIAREERAFKPHLTLARFKSEDGVAKLHEALAKAAPFEFGGARSEEFHLYQSVLKRGGAEYTKLATFPFVKAAP
jgi:2'-5' RNA ligase